MLILVAVQANSLVLILVALQVRTLILIHALVALQGHGHTLIPISVALQAHSLMLANTGGPASAHTDADTGSSASTLQAHPQILIPVPL